MYMYMNIPKKDVHLELEQNKIFVLCLRFSLLKCRKNHTDNYLSSVAPENCFSCFCLLVILKTIQMRGLNHNWSMTTWEDSVVLVPKVKDMARLYLCPATQNCTRYKNRMLLGFISGQNVSCWELRLVVHQSQSGGCMAQMHGSVC